MRQSFRCPSRSKLAILFALLSLFLFLFVTIPAYEELNYFKKKNVQLQQKVQELTYFSLLAEESKKHPPLKPDHPQRKIKAFQKTNNTRHFHNALQALQEKLSQLEIHQKTTKEKIEGGFTQMSTSHEFLTSFSLLQKYLMEVGTPNTGIIFNRLTVENEDLLEKDPKLRVKSNLSFYIKEP